MTGHEDCALCHTRNLVLWVVFMVLLALVSLDVWVRYL